MRLHADTLFTYDATGRMLRSNEPDGPPAPRVFFGYTLEGYVVRFGASVPDALVRQFMEMMEREPAVTTLDVPPTILTRVREALEQDGPIRWERSGPDYQFPGQIAGSSEVVQVTDSNIDVVRDTYPWLYGALAAWHPCFAVMHDGVGVSVCYSSRLGADACEAGVDTLPAFRGRGYAAAATAAWGASVRAAGRVPLYSREWDNVASEGVARRVGLIMFGADVTWG
jgi:RimJ/RimL family protein N-acetyltransferase